MRVSTKVSVARGGSFLSRFHASRGESGVTIVELMIALTIFAVVASGVAVGMGSALGLTRNNRNRSIAANLAAKEMDVVRSTPFASLPLSGANHTETVDGIVYTIDRATTWASRDGTTGICDPPAGTSLAFLKILVTVTWPDMGGVEPVQSETIIAPPVGSYNADLGHIAVQIRDRDAAPASNHVVTAVGPGGTYTQTTQNGCAFFVGLTPGVFEVFVNTPGYVDGQGVQRSEDSVAVKAGAISSAEFDYDLAAAINATLHGISGYGVPSGIGLRVANTGLELGTLPFSAESGGACTAPTSTLYSTADAQVTNEHPATSYGLTTSFGVRSKIDKQERSLVTFALPSSVPENCQLATATLRLWVNRHEGSHNFEAYRVSSAWSEATVTWNTQPTYTGTPATVPAPSENEWVDFQVRSIVNAMMAGTNYGFLVKDATVLADDENKMDSREMAHDPELVLQWVDTGPICLSYTLPAIDDTRVQQDGASANQQKGGENEMKVRSDATNKNQRSYINFSIPAPAGCTLTSATLRLWASGVQGPRTIEAYRVAGPWTEETVWWNNQPGFTGTPTSTVVSATGWQTWDVLDLLSGGNTNGFVLKDLVEEGDPAKEQKFRTKENGTEENHPQLVLIYSPLVTYPDSKLITASGLFPYSNGYQVWGGLCADNDPEGVDIGTGLAYWPGAQREPVVATDPNTTTPALVNLKSLDITVKLSNNSPVSMGLVKAVHAADSGCTDGKTLIVGSTNASGIVRVALPYGTWELQVENRTPVGSWPTVSVSPLTADPQSQQVTVN